MNEKCSKERKKKKNGIVWIKNRLFLLFVIFVSLRNNLIFFMFIRFPAILLVKPFIIIKWEFAMFVNFHTTAE